ncbi:ArgE/DapE family deacylase [Schumannella luteola]
MDPVALAQQLIAIDSVNPTLVPGAAGESAIADYCAEWLESHGFEVERLERDAGRPTIVGVSRGTGGGASLLLSGHLDTVGVATWPGDPFSGAVVDGRLIGRGAFDMKGGLAAVLVAAVSVAERRGDVVVALVADEEFGSRGTEEVLERYRADAAIITEPSQLEVTVAHRGFAWFRIDVEGIAAHGSMPEQGVDAIAHAGLIMRRLDELQSALSARGTHPLLQPGTVRVSTISGGVDAATVAPSCTLTIERRFLPGESPDAVEQELRDALRELLGERASLTRLVARGAFEAGDSHIRAVVRDQLEAVTGVPAVERGEPFWTDAGLVAEAGIPTVLLGVVGGGAHADDEWASTQSIVQLTEVLRGTIAEFCR